MPGLRVTAQPSNTWDDTDWIAFMEEYLRFSARHSGPHRPRSWEPHASERRTVEAIQKWNSPDSSEYLGPPDMPVLIRSELESDGRLPPNSSWFARETGSGREFSSEVYAVTAKECLSRCAAQNREPCRDDTSEQYVTVVRARTISRLVTNSSGRQTIDRVSVPIGARLAEPERHRISDHELATWVELGWRPRNMAPDSALAERYDWILENTRNPPDRADPASFVPSPTNRHTFTPLTPPLYQAESTSPPGYPNPGWERPSAAVPSTAHTVAGLAALRLDGGSPRSTSPSVVAPATRSGLPRPGRLAQATGRVLG
ncbi:hypothetical protein ABT336_26225 [Micromonospora sp. NPDC000207]|uniref:hypothetical protein n=1 Tax=Micromonospora sp. NPDC000207 TaxID=3154246 RepID=UPI00331BCFD5